MLVCVGRRRRNGDARCPRNFSDVFRKTEKFYVYTVMRKRVRIRVSALIWGWGCGASRKVAQRSSVVAAGAVAPFPPFKISISVCPCCLLKAVSWLRAPRALRHLQWSSLRGCFLIRREWSLATTPPRVSPCLSSPWRALLPRPTRLIPPSPPPSNSTGAMDMTMVLAVAAAALVGVFFAVFVRLAIHTAAKPAVKAG